MELGLAHRCALVTGSSSGIGEAIARSLAREGASVVIHGRNLDRANAVAEDIVAAGGRAKVVVGDLLRQGDAARVALEAVALFGGIDILVNNAGGRTSSARSSWSAVDADDWADCYRLNVVAPAVLVEQTLPHMRSQDWGRVIQISSAVAFRPLPNNADYAASKGALSALTVSLSQELAGSHITANTVSPGATSTPALINAMRAQAQATGQPDDTESLERAAAALWPCAAQRLGRPEEIADMVTFLASDRGAFVTGANIRVDGGRSGVAT